MEGEREREWGRGRGNVPKVRSSMPVLAMRPVGSESAIIALEYALAR